MKNLKKKTKLTFLLGFLLLFISFGIFFITSNQIQNKKNHLKSLNPLNPKTNYFYENQTILIDDLDPNYDWETIRDNYSWCTGLGTKAQPFIINSTIFDPNGLGSCLVIRNSIKYFIIQNSTFINSGSGDWNAGIKLVNVSSGRIINNNCSTNQRYAVLFRNGCENNNISFNYIGDNYGGILIDHSHNNRIDNNTIMTTTMRDGINLYYSNNNKVSDNVVYQCGTSNGVVVGINLLEAYDNLISRNTLTENAGGGLEIADSNNNTIKNNNIHHNQLGGFSSENIWLIRSHNNTITQNQAYDSTTHSIWLTDSNSNILSFNTIYDSNAGIYVNDGQLNDIQNNTIINNNDGIKFYTGGNNSINENYIINNLDGIELDQSHNNLISGNLFNLSINGLRLTGSDENSIYENGIYFSNYGMIFTSSYLNTLEKNIILDVGADGIDFRGGNTYNIIINNTIREIGKSASPSAGIDLSVTDDYNYLDSNKLKNNRGYGIQLSQTDHNNVTENIFINNTECGLYIPSGKDNRIFHNIFNRNNKGIVIRGFSINDYAEFNNLSYNQFQNNTIAIHFETLSVNNTVSFNEINKSQTYGILLDPDTENNLMFQNSFNNNGIHAKDDGSFNYWNNSIVGNYWDNYTGDDSDDDGLGDTPYSFLGGTDYLPIWIDEDDVAPTITIESPNLNKLFSFDAPSFEIVIEEFYSYTTWYTLDNGDTNNTFTGASGTINQTLWDNLPNGTITLTFYIKDSVDRITSDSVKIHKDIVEPNITINYPVLDEIIGISAPNFNLSIDENNLDKIWYVLDNGIITTQRRVINQTIGIIDQDIWDYYGDGSLSIIFYANDTMGNEAHNQVDIVKDNAKPLVSILYPLINSYFSSIAPNYTVNIQDANLEKMWYSLDGGLNNYTFTKNGTINQEAWGNLTDEIVNIIFFANDSGGNTGYSSITIQKDIDLPEINLISPNSGELFGNDAPSFIIEISDENLEHTWYSLDGGLNNFTFTNNGTINEGSWDSFGTGVITITFYANDSSDNLISLTVNVEKDIDPPIILINNPISEQEYGLTPPNYSLSITEPHLDSIWFIIGTNLTKHFIFNSDGIFDAKLWERLDEGNITIQFYVNDTLSNINSEDVTIIKNLPSQSSGGIPGFNMVLLLLIICFISTMIIIQKSKKIKL